MIFHRSAHFFLFLTEYVAWHLLLLLLLDNVSECVRFMFLILPLHIQLCM